MGNGLEINKSLYGQNPYLSQYGATSSMYDPYFAMAYSSPNLNAMTNQATTGSSNTTSTSGNTTSNQNVAMGASSTQEKSSSNSAAWGILGTVALVGAAALCVKAHKKGAGEGFLKKTWDGLKKMFKSDNTNLLKNKNISEYIVKKDGITYEVKNGNVTKIVTTNSKVIPEKELPKYVADNNLQSTIDNLKVSPSNIPNGVTTKTQNNKLLYVYTEPSTGRKIYFNDKKEIKKVVEINEKTYVKQEEIDKLIKDNDKIKTCYEQVKAGDTQGYKIKKTVYKNEDGQYFTVKGNKITGVTLPKETKINGTSYKAGDEISGKDLEEWAKLAENNSNWKSMQQVIDTAKKK